VIGRSSYRLYTKVSTTLSAQKEDLQIMGDDGVFLFIKDLLLSTVIWFHPLLLSLGMCFVASATYKSLLNKRYNNGREFLIVSGSEQWHKYDIIFKLLRNLMFRWRFQKEDALLRDAMNFGRWVVE